MMKKETKSKNQGWHRVDSREKDYGFDICDDNFAKTESNASVLAHLSHGCSMPCLPCKF